MTKFLKKCLAVFGLLFTLQASLLLLVSVSTQFTPLIEKLTFGHVNEWGSTYQRSIDYNKKKNKIDAIILGSSTAYRNINPEILKAATNMEWFNLGSSAQSLQMSEALLRYLVLMNEHKPKLILLDIYESLLTNNGQESTLDHLKNANFSSSLKFNLWTKNPTYLGLIQILYREIKKRTKGVIYFESSENNGQYMHNGFVCSPQQENSWQGNLTRKSLSFLKRNKTLLKVIETCKKNKIKLIVNVSPELGIFWHPSKSILDGTPLLVHNEFTDSVKLFYDTHHMVCAGSEIYSKSLAKKMVDALR